MSLVWLALIFLHCMQNMKLFQRAGFGNSTTFLDGGGLTKYLIGLGQGSRGAPPSWIQLSSVIVNVLRGLDCGAMIADPITGGMIHTVGSMFVDDTDLNYWQESLKLGEELFEKIQEETNAWGNLLIATGGCLKLDKCFWYLLNYDCVDRVWEPAKTKGCELLIPKYTGSPNPLLSWVSEIVQLEETTHTPNTSKTK